MSYGYKCGADLPCVAEQSVCLRIYVVLLVSLLLVCCSSLSRAGESDYDVAGGDPFSFMLFGLFSDYRDGVSQSICVE